LSCLRYSCAKAISPRSAMSRTSCVCLVSIKVECRCAKGQAAAGPEERKCQGWGARRQCSSG
jgi:hypothetical protein